MATCKECIKEDVCEIRHRIDLIDDVCEHFIYKNHIEMSVCEENRLRILCDERLQEIHNLNQVIDNINYMIQPIIERGRHNGKVY